MPLNPASVKNVTEHPEHLILNVIAGKSGNAAGLPSSRSYTVRVFNTSTPKAIKVNGENVKDFTYDAESKCTVVEVPVTSCASTATVEIEEAVSGVADLALPKARVFYDKASDTLTAELGHNRQNVEFAMFNLAGTECPNRKYQDISGFSEKLGMLPESNMYICKIVSDNQVIIDKISK